MSEKYLYEEDGFVIVRDAIPKQSIEEFETYLEGQIRKYAREFAVSTEGSEAATDLMSAMHDADKARFKTLLGTLGASGAGFRVAVHEGVVAAMESFGIANWDDLFPSLPGLFFNSPKARQLQYDWHQERSYYPDLGHQVITIWTPLFRHVGDNDGPMYLCRKSHRKSLPYEIEFRKAGLMQLSIADDDLADFEKIPCLVDRGDLVIFHTGTAHRTGENLSDQPRVNLICRFHQLTNAVTESLPLASASATSREEYIRRAANAADIGAKSGQ